ncbi:hypothetical protein TNCV_1418841 [Trichonephila clavipes]|nr:hypothetical protein TNCV_1418841 [Trichonephila clavipes]
MNWSLASTIPRRVYSHPVYGPHYRFVVVSPHSSPFSSIRKTSIHISSLKSNDWHLYSVDLTYAVRLRDASLVGWSRVKASRIVSRVKVPLAAAFPS